MIAGKEFSPQAARTPSVRSFKAVKFKNMAFY
jgi:hypothetical protein